MVVNRDSEQAVASRQHNFWLWLRTSRASRGGIDRWLNRFLILHAGIGSGFAWLFTEWFPVDLSARATSVILPLAGVLVGLTFAWSATAITIISSKEFRRLMVRSQQGVGGTANYFQLAILAVMICTVLWALAGMGPYPVPNWLPLSLWYAKFASAAFLFAFTSFAITECWSAIDLTRMSLLGFVTVREVEDKDEAESAPDKP